VQLDGLEGIRARFILDRHPAPLGKLVPVRGTAVPGSVAGGADPSKRDYGLIIYRLIINMSHPDRELASNCQCAFDRAGDHAGRQAVLWVGG
jgi:hypothetical protein